MSDLWGFTFVPSAKMIFEKVTFAVVGFEVVLIATLKVWLSSASSSAFYDESPPMIHCA